jgi:hypothetical protein
LPPAAVLLCFYHRRSRTLAQLHSTPGFATTGLVGIDNYRALADDPIFWQAL